MLINRYIQLFIGVVAHCCCGCAAILCTRGWECIKALGPKTAENSGLITTLLCVAATAKPKVSILVRPGNKPLKNWDE